MQNSHDSGNGARQETSASKSPQHRFAIPQILFSMKFAIWIAVILAVASIAGVLVQEFYPVRNSHQAHALSEILPQPVYGLFMLLQLYDPFRALWFRVLLGLLALSLLLCSLRNFRPNFRQAFQVLPIRDPGTLTRLPDSYKFNRVSPMLFDFVVRRLRRRLFFGSAERSNDQRTAVFHRGGIARTGPVLLHVGILTLVVGGLLSSVVGQRTVLMGSPGEVLALGDGAYQLRVDDFDIDTNEVGQVRQYRSRVTVLEDGNELLQRQIEVNKPLRFAGFNIYQSTYQADPTRASSLQILVRPRLAEDDAGHGEDGHAHATPGEVSAAIEAQMDAEYDIPGYPGYTFRARRFFAHLTITAEGPVNASRDLVNPAVELEVRRSGEPQAIQWAFARFPAHAREELPFVLELGGAEPVLATGLEVNTNPGAPLIWFGLVVSTLALVFCFLIQHHTIYVVAQPAKKGWTLWLAGRSTRERIAFSNAFDRFARNVHREAKRLKALEREVEAPAPASVALETPTVPDAEAAHR
jgi:cytochrome c biogenesis protein